MRRFAQLVLLCLAVVGLVRSASAEGFTFLGVTAFHDNDVLLDGDDRWQTGGASVSWMFGPDGTLGLPDRPGEVWELRVRAQVITPDNFTAPAAWDRRAASVLTTTLHTHFAQGGLEVSAGAGVALTGPRTKLIDFQNIIHWLTPANDPRVPAAVRANQIPNGVYATALGEAAWRFRLGESITLRPFVEAQAGVETFLRAGADVFFGVGFDGGLLSRSGTTGFAYQTLEGVAPRGFSFTLGADAAHVFHSALLPTPAYDLTPLRLRARAGLNYQGRWASVFTGFTWLGPEFSAQPEGQVVTAFQVQFRF